MMSNGSVGSVGAIHDCNQMFVTKPDNGFETDFSNPLSVIDSIGSVTPQWIFSPFCGSSSMPALFSTTSTFPEFAHLKPLSLPLNISLLPSVKDVLKFKNCTLHPPKANTAVTTTRERPPGCRTVFVGGIPDNATEESLKEVFSFCGEITVIRMSKKNFCHIRFSHEESVDKALSLSGYRMKINDQDDAANTGRLHVDFAQARDDQHEYECKQRAMQREMRHRGIGEPIVVNPAAVRYSENEALLLIEKLKSEEAFMNAVHLLISWFEKGECRKKNCGQFYSMLQTANSQMRKLQTERNEYEVEMQRSKQLYLSKMQSILMQFGLIEKVFEVASQQKVWDHFTKAQRKNITVWKQQAKEVKTAHLEEVVNKRQEDEMELSDDDEDASSGGECEKRKNCTEDFNCKRLNVEVVNSNLVNTDSMSQSTNEEAESTDVFDDQEGSAEKQIQLLQKTVQGLQYQLLTLREQKVKDDIELEKLRNLVENKDKQQTITDSQTNQPTDSNRIPLSILNGRILSLISIYLNIHPLGSSSDCIYRYIKSQSINVQLAVTIEEIEDVLQSFPFLFRKNETTSFWQYIGFDGN